jgi:hypothetical protein
MIAIEQSANVGTMVDTMATLAKQLPWPERLSLLVSTLKMANIYGASSEVVVNAIKENPAAATIQAPRDIWAVVDWLTNQPKVDVLGLPPINKVNSR